MAEFRIDGRMKAKGLKEKFKEPFGLIFFPLWLMYKLIWQMFKLIFWPFKIIFSKVSSIKNFLMVMGVIAISLGLLALIYYFGYKYFTA